MGSEERDLGWYNCPECGSVDGVTIVHNSEEIALIQVIWGRRPKMRTVPFRVCTDCGHEEQVR